jgi:dTDP-glucose pyrophosphorylase
MKGLILAAGRGSRLTHITKGENKCLIEVNHKPVIVYAAEHLCSIEEITECIVVVGYKAQDVMEALGDKINGVNIVYCLQEEQLGLIHAMETGMPALNGEDFMMVLGDEFIIDNNYQEAVRDFTQSEDFCRIGYIEVNDKSLVKKTYTYRYDSSHHCVDFVEKPEKPYNHLMGTGNVLFRGDVLNMLLEVPVNPIRGERELVGLFTLLNKERKQINDFCVGKKYINLNTGNDVEILERELQLESVLVS